MSARDRCLCLSCLLVEVRNETLCVLRNICAVGLSARMNAPRVNLFFMRENSSESNTSMLFGKHIEYKVKCYLRQFISSKRAEKEIIVRPKRNFTRGPYLWWGCSICVLYLLTSLSARAHLVQRSM